MVVENVVVERSVGFSSNRVFRLVGRDVRLSSSITFLHMQDPPAL
jgi:hypothetical protein